MSSDHTYVFINFRGDAAKTKKKLCVARMVNNEYTVIWDARVPGNTTSVLRYDFGTDYYVAVAGKETDDGAPKLVAGPLAVTTGQLATYTGSDKLKVDNSQDNSRSFVYLNADPTNPTHAVLTQTLGVKAFTVPKSSANAERLFLFDDAASDAIPESPISFSPEVVQGAGTFKVVPRWNVYAGDGAGLAVDSLAFWWTEEEVKSGTVIEAGKVKGPSLTDPETVVFDALPGSQINIDISTTGWGQVAIQPPTADDK